MIVEKKNPLLQLLYPLFIVLSYLFLYLPIIILVLFSFNDAPVATRWVGFSLRWYRELFASIEILEAFKVSLIVATSSTMLSLFLGTLFVLSSKWWRSHWFFNLFYINVFYRMACPKISYFIRSASTTAYRFCPYRHRHAHWQDCACESRP